MFPLLFSKLCFVFASFSFFETDRHTYMYTDSNRRQQTHGTIQGFYGFECLLIRFLANGAVGWWVATWLRFTVSYSGDPP